MSQIPTCITRCCRDWVSPPPGIYKPAPCGHCGELPKFVEWLPEDQWVTTPEPIREPPELPPVPESDGGLAWISNEEMEAGVERFKEHFPELWEKWLAWCESEDAR